MNLDERVNKCVSQHTNEHEDKHLKDSELKKLKKTKEFVERHYPEIIAPIYFGLESLLLYRVESFNESFLDNHSIRALMVSLRRPLMALSIMPARNNNKQ